MTRQDRFFHALRWPGLFLASALMLLLVWWVLPLELGGMAGLVGVIGFLPITFVDYVVHYLLALNFVAVLLLTIRYMFPAGKGIAPRLTRTGPPTQAMVLTVALMIAALFTGLTLTLMEAGNLWTSLIYDTEFTTAETHLFRIGPGLAITLVFWAGSIALLRRRWRQGDAMQQVGRATRGLAIWAMLLVTIAIIIHERAIERDPDLFHQGFGSYTGLLLGLAVLAWSLLTAAIRHFFIRDYHQALAARHEWRDDPAPRGRMSITFRLIYMARRLMFASVALIMTVVLWLMATDIFIRIPLGHLTMRHLEQATNHWLLPDHGIRGIMGLYPATRVAHLLMSVTGIVLFLLSQYLFERPWWNSLQSLTRHGRLRWSNAIGLAMPAAGLTVGAVALALEWMGLWSQLIAHAGLVSDRRYAGIIVEPTFWIAMPTLAGSFILWALVLRMMKLPATLFYQRAQVLFTLFVVAGAELFIAGMVQSISYGYGGQFWNRGTFTTACLGASIAMWTFIPSLRLIYAGQAYAAIMHPYDGPSLAQASVEAVEPDQPGNAA